MTDTKLEEMARMWRAGVPRKSIAKKFGYTDDYVAHLMMRNRKLFPYRRKNIDKEVKDQCVELIMSGDATTKRIAEILGVTVSSVRTWVRNRKKEGDA